jgi:hypothetical protein
MALSGLSYPDHVTISRFRKDNTDVMDDLFDQVLVLCAKAGLGNLEHVAVDGTKIVADASPVLSRDVDGLRGTGRRWLAEAAKVDDEEDERFGAARGDELPEELRDPEQRKRVIAELLGQAGDDPDRERGQARQRKARKAAQALESADELQAEAEQRAEAGLTPWLAKVAKLEATLERVRAQILTRYEAGTRRRAEAAAQGRRLGGSPRMPIDEHSHVRRAVALLEAARQDLAARRAAAPPVPGRRNLTDPDARFMPTQRDKFILGYNTQLAVSADHLIVAYDVVQDPGDSHQLVPMLARLDASVTMLREATGNPDLAVGTALFDAGYASEANLAAPGPNRLVALGKRGKIAGEDPPTSPPDPASTETSKMAWLLNTAEGKALYKKRGATVEPVNSHLKQARGLHRFSRRGLPAAKAEVAIAAFTTNLLRLFTTTANATA